MLTDSSEPFELLFTSMEVITEFISANAHIAMLYRLNFFKIITILFKGFIKKFIFPEK